MNRSVVTLIAWILCMTTAPVFADSAAEMQKKLQKPLGLSYNQTIDMGNGHGFDFMIGPYYNMERPRGAARWQIRFGLNWLFP